MSCDRCHTNAPLKGHNGRMLCFDCRNEVPLVTEQPDEYTRVKQIILNHCGDFYTGDDVYHVSRSDVAAIAEELAGATKRESGTPDHWDLERFKESPWFTGYASDESKGVYKLALAMCDKLATKKAQGYTGWDDEDDCPNERLVNLLIKHVPKGDPIDIANFCMMLYWRGITNFKNYLRESNDVEGGG